MDQILKNGVLDNLQYLSDADFQERVWVKGLGPEVSSFTEAVCGLYDDSGLDDRLSDPKHRPVLSEDIDSDLEKLSQILGSGLYYCLKIE